MLAKCVSNIPRLVEQSLRCLKQGNKDTLMEAELDAGKGFSEEWNKTRTASPNSATSTSDSDP